MNTLPVIRLVMLLLSLGFGLPVAGIAQTPAFTYQGRLDDGGTPASGVYDFEFRLYEVPEDGMPIAGPVVLAGVTVTGGQFTARLDFGAGAFTGPDRWLEMGVRLNGSGSFLTLAPRQPVTSAPHAIVANSANNLNGTIALAQLPAAVLTNNQIGVSLSGTFSGNATGLTNVPGAMPSEIVAEAFVATQPNTAYDAIGGSRLNLFLPINANVGDSVQVSGVGFGGWQVVADPPQSIRGISADLVWLAGNNIGFNRGVACSADGMKIVSVGAPGQVRRSVDGGITWSSHDPYLNWVSVASSADGERLVGVVINGQIYTSTDGGVNWTARETDRRWIWVASSADGLRLAAVVNGGQIFTSSDGGTTWVARESNRNWWSIASSADGLKLVAGVAGGQVYTSTDGGTNWAPQSSSRNWDSIASSADGNRLIAAASSQLLLSLDGGTNWSPRESFRSWRAVASSADGSALLALVQDGRIYSTTNSGDTWTASETNRNWYVAAMSADGSKLIAGVNGQDIYTSYYGAVLRGGQGSSLELTYAGNGVWQPLNRIQDPAAVALLDANQTFSGQNQFTSINNSFTGNGSGLIGLNAANIFAGTVADARLSANVALRGGGNAFTGNQTIAGSVGIGITPQSALHVNGTARIQGADQWDVNNNEGDFRIGSDTHRFKIGVAQGGGGAGDVWMRAQGGTGRLFLKTPGGTTIFSNEAQTNGVSLASGGGSWTSVSDRNAKENLEPVDAPSVLAQVTALPLSSWNYKSQDVSIRHLGPMAQDFRAAFGLGETDTGITTVDADGVALAAIQGLNAKVESGTQETKTELAELRAENAALKARLDKLEQLLGNSRQGITQ